MMHKPASPNDPRPSRPLMALALSACLVGLPAMAQMHGMQGQGAQVLPIQAQDEDRLTAFLAVTGFDAALDSIALSAGDAPLMLGRNATEFGADW
jgi:hypothetical protein